MTYRNGQHLHQYITTRASNQETANGDAKQALIDTYYDYSNPLVSSQSDG